MDDDDNVVFPTVCEEDIEVLKQIGSTNISLHKNEAIQIDSQDRSTLTVQLQQVWESPPFSSDTVKDENLVLFVPWTDYIYHACCPNNLDEVCFEETKVEHETLYANDLTIQCAVTKLYGLLEICIPVHVKNEQLSFSSVEDNAVVPKCCHPSFPPETL